MVPVRALAPYGVTLEDAFDPWGNRIAYSVTRQLTPAGSGSVTERPHVRDSVTGTDYGDQDFVLVSYGKDHVGAVQKAQTGVNLTTKVACQSPQTDISSENCNTDDVDFLSQPVNASSNTGSADYFDDIVISYAANSDCLVSTLTWGSAHCNALPWRTMPNGSSWTIYSGMNGATTTGYYGSITVTCSNGSYVVSDPLCATTAGSCTWTAYNDTWYNATSCTGSPDAPPGYSDDAAIPACGGDAPTAKSSTYATAHAAYPNQVCKVAGGCTPHASTGPSDPNYVSASMRNCRP
jgi:hypothetical protein